MDQLISGINKEIEALNKEIASFEKNPPADKYEEKDLAGFISRLPAMTTILARVEEMNEDERDSLFSRSSVNGFSAYTAARILGINY